jgi:hypothetical protein
MTEGHGWSGASRAGSHHPALGSASAPPCPRLIQGGSVCLVVRSSPVYLNIPQMPQSTNSYILASSHESVRHALTFSTFNTWLPA